MTRAIRMRTDWVSALALLFGAAVVVPSLIALLLALAAVARMLV
ncbi:hypothetical protein N1F89_08750 [Aquibium sp. A9E412]|nr:hypothetical protein [Aquibium sp. A9E412]MDN2566308.1 hypothetical protein [Aquibium sp. A9E412]